MTSTRSVIDGPLWLALALLLGMTVAGAGCTSPKAPPGILEDEEFRKITRGTVDLRLGILPPALEKQDLVGDDVAAIQFQPDRLRETLVQEMQAAGPFTGVVMPLSEDLVQEYLSPTFDPGLLPADLYLRIRLQEYMIRDEGHNAAFIPNLLFFLWNPLGGIWPISSAIADESFQARLSAEVHVTSLHSNGIVLRKVYRGLEYTAALNEYRDSTWELVSEDMEQQIWRKLTLEILKDLHTEFLSRTQAGSLEEVLGKLPRQRQWDALKETRDEAIHYSYILGVGDYLSKEIVPLSFVENDARAILDHAKGLSGGKGVVHFYIGRTAGSSATRDYDSGALSTLRDLTQKVTERDTLFVYIAGKGAVLKTDEGTSSYLLLYDTVLERDRIEQTSLPVDRLRDFLAQAKARLLVLLIDLRDIEYREMTQVGEGGGAPAGPPTDFYARIFPQEKEKARGRVLLAAASPGQRAHESEEVRQGAFAYYLLDGVKGGADADGDGQVSVREVYEYLGPRLLKFARLNGQVQEPVLLGEEAAVIPVFPE